MLPAEAGKAQPSTLLDSIIGPQLRMKQLHMHNSALEDTIIYAIE